MTNETMRVLAEEARVNRDEYEACLPINEFEEMERDIADYEIPVGYKLTQSQC